MSLREAVGRWTDERAAASERARRADIALTLGVWIAVLAAMMPLVRVIKPGPWSLGGIVMTALVLLAGFLARVRRLPAVAVTVIELGVWIVLMTVMFLRDTSLLWVLPTPASFREIPGMISSAGDDILLGAAPLEAGADLTFLLVGAAGLLAIIVDHVVLTAGMPLLAAVGLIAVWLIPAIAVPTDPNVVAFVVLAASILFLLRADTRHRSQALDRDGPAPDRVHAAGIAATSLGIGAIAVVVALVAAPLLPPPDRAGAIGFGTGPGIDATLQLGDDLRRPRDVEVMQVRSSSASGPYLRAATLSTFDGKVWQPDRVRGVPLQSDEAFAEPPVDDGIRVVEYKTEIEVKNLASAWLPVPYPAVSIDGVTGDWSAVPYNRTVESTTANSQGQRYEVITHVPQPTLEQIRAHSAGGAATDATLELPAGMPQSIARMAAEVTAGTTNDYDALFALQSWFRGPEFRYSLDTPVEDGFDGTGVEAVAAFLQVKAGYCIHFASAFALMARTLGMPSRIVVGYLPGVSTSVIAQAQTLLSVSSSQLHAWPEVYFDGIGWVPFEPTNSLGSATTFTPAAVAQNLDGGTDVADETQPSASASADPSLRGDEADDPTARGRGTVQAAGWDPTPLLAVVGIVLVLAVLPSLLAGLRRRLLLAAARRGDAAAAWTYVQAAAIDLGESVPASESPRSLGVRLAADGAPPGEMLTLVSAIEEASYGPAPVRATGLAGAAAAVRSGLLRSASPRARMVARWLPRSLVVRAGSVYAGSASVAEARSKAGSSAR